ncbi:MAG: NAD-dependent epimerase/dehydratase family protein [Gaiellaceae bacterium]
MNVLVLGGTGFIGSHVVRMLAARGHGVTILHRGETEADLPASVRHVHAPFERLPELVAELALEARPEVVLDMVPYIDKRGHGVLHLRGVARRAVVITSCDVYRAFGRLWRSEPGPPEPLPLTEDSPLRLQPAPDGKPDDGFDNVEVERAVSGDAVLPVTILRLPATHGPGDAQHRLWRYLQRMQDGRQAIVLEETQAGWKWVRGYVENVAAAVALAVEDERSTGRVYNVAERTAYTEAEWVRRIGEQVGWTGDVIAVPMESLPESLRHRFEFTQHYVLDSGRIRRELGYSEPVDADEGLRRTIEWESRNPPDVQANVDY